MEETKPFIGKVVKLKGGRAFVVPVKRAKNDTKASKEIDAYNSISAKKDDIVEVVFKTTDKKIDRLLLFGPVVLGIVAGVLLGYRLLDYLRDPPFYQTLLLSTFVWTFLGCFFSYRHWRDSYNRGLDPTIIRKKTP